MPDAVDHLARAKSLHASGRLQQAAECCRELLQVGENPEARVLLLRVLETQRHASEAIEQWRQVVRLQPDFAPAYHRLGVLLAEQGRFDEASEHLKRACQLEPHAVEHAQSLSLVFMAKDYAEARVHTSQGRLADAESCYRRILERDPNNFPALGNLGNVLRDQERLDDSAQCFERAAQLRPDAPEPQNDLGVIRERQGHYENAIVHYRRAIALRPDFPSGYFHLANLLGKHDRLDEAEACYRRTLELRPDMAEAHCNLGILLTWQKRPEEAVASLQQSLAIQPDSPEAHFNYGMALLLMGRFEEGWSEYAWLWKSKKNKPRGYSQPLWTGEELAEQTILLYSDHGHGDALQAVRYVDLVQARGGRVWVECQAGLVDLLSRCPAVERVFSPGEAPAGFDVHLPLMRLPAVFQTRANNIPTSIPYVFSDPRLVGQWQRELAGYDGLKVGIAWRGDPANPRDCDRSIPLTEFEGIVRTPGVCAFSLQVGTPCVELSTFGKDLPITDLGTSVRDFHDTAAIIESLDLVITCDSAPAHLAGALGKPVWVAVHFSSDWRWRLSGDITPWYPTMRLFRQPARGDWSDVFQRIEQSLRELADGGPSVPRSL